MSGRWRFLIDLGQLGLGYRNLKTTLSWADPRAASGTRKSVSFGRGIQLLKLMEHLPAGRVSDLLLHGGVVILAVIRRAPVQLRYRDERTVVCIRCGLLLVVLKMQGLHSARVKGCSLRFEEAKCTGQVVRQDLPPVWINSVLVG